MTATSGILNQVATPLLRWPGSKRPLLRHLLSYRPVEYGRYFEPFAGSASFFFALGAQSAVLGDTNAYLIGTYAELARDPAPVFDAFSSYASDPESYYRVRAISPALLDEVARAGRFLYLNRHCFNGLYRTNRRGEFNVPIGSRLGSAPSWEQFLAAATALRAADLRVGDFERTLADIEEGDFVYLDPPYFTPRPHYGEYGYEETFGPGDDTRLEAVLHDLDAAGARFLLSYSLDIEMNMPSSWNVCEVPVFRQIAGNAQHRKRTGEVLVTNMRRLDCANGEAARWA